MIAMKIGYSLDFFAFAVFAASWMGYTWYAEHMHRHKRTLLNVMNEYRVRWMQEMLKRDNRMMDATMIGNLLRSISFFASTSIFIIAGMIGLLSYRERAIDVIETIPFIAEPSPLMWEARVLLLSVIFIYAFFKFTWSLRQYNYACIFVAAAPSAKERLDEHEHIVHAGARLLGNAARHFNMGLRGYYFGLAALSWFIHPVVFIVITLLVVGVLYRREFRSRTLASVAGG